MKTMIIALSAAALIAAATAALAQDVAGKTPDLRHKVSRKHHSGVTGYAPLRGTHAKGSKKGSPAFGYAPGEPGGSDGYFEMSKQPGGGGGGGGM